MGKAKVIKKVALIFLKNTNSTIVAKINPWRALELTPVIELLISTEVSIIILYSVPLGIIPFNSLNALFAFSVKSTVLPSVDFWSRMVIASFPEIYPLLLSSSLVKTTLEISFNRKVFPLLLIIIFSKSSILCISPI